MKRKSKGEKKVTAKDEGMAVRALELPLQSTDDQTWELLRDCWHHSSMLANWAVHALARHDVVRLPGMEKLPDPPDVDLYPLAMGRKKTKPSRKNPDATLLACDPEYAGYEFFTGAKETVTAILQQVRKRYVKNRFEVIWLRRRALDTFRNPFPWPISSGSWRGAWLDEAGKPHVEVTLPGGRGVLRLRGGPEFRRQMGMFRQIVEGKLPKAQMSIYWKRCSESCHRPTCTIGGIPGRVIVKMVAKFPVVEKRAGDRAMVLLTDPNALWVAELDGGEKWVLNRDDIRRNVARHQHHLCVLKRLSDDCKAERRLKSGRAKVLEPKIRAMCHKDRNRIDSAVKETAANLVNYAARRRVSEIFYLDRDKGFMPSFPWFELHKRLSDLCEVQGIGLYSESSALPPDEASKPFVVPGDIVPTSEDARWERVAHLREMAITKVIAGKRRRGSHPAVAVPSKT